MHGYHAGWATVADCVIKHRQTTVFGVLPNGMWRLPKVVQRLNKL